MKEVPEAERRRPPSWKRIGVFIAGAWVLALGYMVLVADPPDFWFDDIATVDAPGHALAGFVSGVAAYLLLARRRHAFLLAIASSLALLGARTTRCADKQPLAIFAT